MLKVQHLNSLRTLNIELLNLELKTIARQGSLLNHSHGTAIRVIQDTARANVST